MHMQVGPGEGHEATCGGGHTSHAEKMDGASLRQAGPQLRQNRRL